LGAAFRTLIINRKREVVAGKSSTFKMIILIAGSAEGIFVSFWDFSRTRITFSFFANGVELQVRLLKKLKISLFSTDASGKADW
jgi:hypothetical protein